MTYLLDSDWVIAYLAGRQSAVGLLTRLAPMGMAISLMTYGEVYEGIYYGRDPRAAEQGFLGFLRAVQVLPVGRMVMRQFARLRGHLRSRGQLIGDPDL